MNETMEMLLQKDVSDSIVDRIHETRHRIAAYFGKVLQDNLTPFHGIGVTVL